MRRKEQRRKNKGRRKEDQMRERILMTQGPLHEDTKAISFALGTAPESDQKELPPGIVEELQDPKDVSSDDSDKKK